MEPEQSLQLQIRECLTGMGISSPVDWDVLVFVYRHQSSLANAEQIARMVGYPPTVVNDALENLESLKLLRRSRASSGASLYRCVPSVADSPSYDYFRQLIASVEHRTGRLGITKELRKARTENHNG
jgi:MarR family